VTDADVDDVIFAVVHTLQHLAVPSSV